VAESSLVVKRAEYVFDQSLTLAKATRQFFYFWRSQTGVNDRRPLEDCFFFDLHVPIYVEKWPRQPGPANPAVFEDAFEAILGKLIGNDNVLALHVESGDPEYFDEQLFIKDWLAPRHMDYVLLPSRLDPQSPPQTGNLLFEWPSDSGSLRYIVDHWFMCPQVTIEGYVSVRSCLGTLAERYFEPYNVQNIRNALEVLEFGFKLWPDNNGLFVLSEKFDEDALRGRLAGPDLDAVI
jgi:hypothetical protein